MSGVHGDGDAHSCLPINYMLTIFLHNIIIPTPSHQIEVDGELTANAWHNVTLRNIGRGSEALQASINGLASDFTTISGPDTELDLELLDGPLYIGGDPRIVDVQVHKHTLNISH